MPFNKLIYIPTCRNNRVCTFNLERQHLISLCAEMEQQLNSEANSSLSQLTNKFGFDYYIFLLILVDRNQLIFKLN